MVPKLVRERANASYTYRISLNGRFLFRTEVDNDSKRVQQVGNELAKRFPKMGGFHVVMEASLTTTKAAPLEN